MKKMLSVLTALALGSTTAATVVACGPAEQTLEKATPETFAQVLTNLGKEEKLVFNLKVNTVKESPEFWSQITSQVKDYLKNAGFEIKGQYNLGFTEAPSQEQLNELGFEWHSGKLINEETGERDFSKAAIKLEMKDEDGKVTKTEVTELHWIIKVVE